ncbi:hypothetical protein J6590_068400 [Homalodisca vitripennis]|nr:hypothetical protein J6590_068400 [Homalodisca vitripennis]
MKNQNSQKSIDFPVTRRGSMWFSQPVTAENNRKIRSKLSEAEGLHLENMTEYGCIPQRYVFGIMGFLAVANAYAMRSVLSVAITEMVVVHHGMLGNRTLIPDPMACPAPNGAQVHHVNPENEFDWDEKTQGYILSAFFWGYVLTHLPGGQLAEKFGGKQTLGLGILCTSVLTIATPFAARAGPWWLIVTRFIEGLGEVSLNFPSEIGHGMPEISS